MRSHRLTKLFSAHLCIFLLVFSAQAQWTSVTDSSGDIDPGITTANGTLDIVKLEVGDTASDVILKLTVNGAVPTTDWAKYMIGIANQKTAGTPTGNGWGRPINLNAGVTNGVTNGMTHWIGSWVDGGGGAQLWTFNGTSWSESFATYNTNSPFPAFSISSGAQSTISYTISKASLGVANGDTILLDAYASGGGGGDSAIDALANPGVSVTGWGGPYTSSGTNLVSYTLNNTLLNSTQTITFSVDMTTQVAFGNLNPTASTPDQVSVEYGAGFGGLAYLTDADNDGVYTGTATVSAPENTSVPYRYVIEPGDQLLPLVRETVSRTFLMPGTALAITPTPYFENVQGYREVTFSVNMNIQSSLGNFVLGTDFVEIRGPFNNWSGGTSWRLTDADSDGIYTATFRFGGTANQAIEYKFFAGGTLGWESVANRNFNLTLNTGGSPTPAQVLNPAYFNNASGVRNVTFAVDMSIQQALGLFDPATGTVQLRSGSFGDGDARTLTRVGTSSVFSTTFAVAGDENGSFAYKFWSPGINFYNILNNTGFEQVNLADQFQNRSVTLGANGLAQDAGTAFFSNQRFFVIGAPGAFNTTQGTESASGSVTVTGQGLTADVVATAPAGCEVSADGTSFAGTATLVPTAGVLNAASLYIRIASTAAAGAVTGNVSLASTGSQSATVAVSGTVTAVGSTFTGWLGASVATPELLTQYAFGAASPSSAVNSSNLPSGSATNGSLVLTYFVRKDAQNGSLVTPQVHTDLTDTNGWGALAASNIAAVSTNTVDGVEVVKKTATVPIDSTARKFLRLKVAD